MTIHWTQRAHASIQQLTPYQPGKPIRALERELGITNIIKLASNENPLGPSPKVLESLAQHARLSFRYPDADSFALKEALAEYHQLPPTHFLLGNGSDELFRLITQTFVSPGDEVLFFQYGFSAYPICAQAYQAKPIAIPVHHWQPDIAALSTRITGNTKIIFIANPNNPTGTWITQAQLEALLKRTPPEVLIVLDEAYIDYVDTNAVADYPNAQKLQANHPNLIITRTFSKAYGIAGLRIGYAILAPELANLLNRIRLPFNINLFAQEAGLTALGDRDHVAQSIANNQTGYKILSDGLTALDLDVLPSLGNFVMVDFKQPAQPIYESLLQEGIIVRPLANYGLMEQLRITIGLPTENERFLASLSNVLS